MNRLARPVLDAYDHRVPKPTGLIAPQQQRSRQKLRQLFEATDALLRQRPFDDLSIAEICTAAGVSTGTFYNRFRSKDALLTALYDDYWERHQAILTACLATLDATPDVEDRLQRVIDHFVDDYQLNAGVLRSIILRWRRQAKVIHSSEHRETIEAYGRLARALAGPGHDPERAMYCLHLIANLCRDFILFPELLADATVPHWRRSLRERLLSACRGVIETA